LGMDDEHFTAQQIAAVTMAIYPFVEAYGLPMNVDDVELLAVAVLGATPERSLDELLERSKRLLADDRERAAQTLEGMKQRQLVEREDPTGEGTTIAERTNEAMSRIALDLPEETVSPSHRGSFRDSSGRCDTRARSERSSTAISVSRKEAALTTFCTRRAPCT
jgi:hypothetical protein